MRLAAFSLGVLLTACASSVEPSARADAIVGGTDAPDDRGVYLLLIEGSNGASSTCSATLIAPRTLLTAAHCLDPVILGAGTLTVTATNVSDRSDLLDGGSSVKVVETRVHPSWAPAIGLGADLGLALLETAQTTPPVPFSMASISMLGGAPVRALGYGSIGNDQDAGVRRSVDLTIRQLSTELITLGNEVDKGICHGDSGGPTLFRGGDGVERLIGVHSFTRTAACVDGADTRLDAYGPFLLEWLSDHEDTCGTDGICSTTPCPQLDVDCIGLGGACATRWQCPKRQCVSDTQHAEPYCTTGCLNETDCTGGMSCDVPRGVCQRPQLPTVRPDEPCAVGATFCLGATVCGGPDAARATCMRPCSTSDGCPSPQLCKTGFNGQNVCTTPAVSLPLATLEAPAAPGCSTGVGLTPLVGLLLLRRRAEATARRARNC